MKSIILSSKLLFLFASTMLVSALSCGGNTTANKTADSASVAKPKSSVSSILSEKQFNDLFPQRNKFYTYAAFIKAADELGEVKIKITRRAVSVYQFIRTDKSGKATVVRQDADWNEGWAKQKPDSAFTVNYGEFCTAFSADVNKKELAAFFAQISHETRHGMNASYTDGLMLIHETNTANIYISDSDEYPAVKGKTYYGRGPMQLSYNGNYGYASNIIFGDPKILLNKPELVETDPVVAFKAAIYFWMTPETHKPSAHDVMTGKWQPNAVDKAHGRTTPGFGMTINIVNGDVECGKGDNVEPMNDRIGFYQFYLKKLGITDANCACSCGKMEPYKY
ncbi:chitinase [Mucilaginibacter flavus]|uniref:chitinase n=1 Tax=Mucilaginibacter flavus TaxID=931504 RepID=UPI0025B413F2|nr:chitinase [Mucilaginibacter flavus]MDN3579827.1 chitinase [Mucilaginibacter flavus]